MNSYSFGLKIFKILISFIFLASFCAFGKNNIYENLSKEEQKIMYQKEVEKEVKRLLCNTFITESYDYEAAKRKRKFVRFYVYFTDYNKRFDRLKSGFFYGTDRHAIRAILNARGVPIDKVEYKDMPLPILNELNCSDDIQKWNALKGEWDNLKNTLPDEFFGK